ncbi:MAG: LemA family protein [Clostridia bacterium]|nr:LemA family protein [Clostridia bacterium]
MKNKGLIITLAIIGVIVIILAVLAISSYNGLVDQEEAVKEKQSTISVQLQRRADLIPNFVETVKGYSDYEQSTYTAVTEARSAVMKAIGAEDQAAASAQLDSAIDIWVNAITEAYPELKASEQYKALQDELAGTENRIARARKDYNDAASEYNKSVRRFPKSIFAGMFGFEQVEYFEADEAANQVPQVSFD